jgi:hypothetical protein
MKGPIRIAAVNFEQGRACGARTNPKGMVWHLQPSKDQMDQEKEIWTNEDIANRPAECNTTGDMPILLRSRTHHGQFLSKIILSALLRKTGSRLDLHSFRPLLENLIHDWQTIMSIAS